MRGDRQPRRSAVAPSAPGRSAGRPRQAQPRRFRPGTADGPRPRRSHMSAVERSAGGGRAGIQAQVTAAKTSFYWAMRFLPKPRREAMFAIYAFCRDVDDIADSDEKPAAKQAGLAEWRREIAEFYAGRPRGTLSAALAQAVADYRLRQADFLAVIDGMEMDARADSRPTAQATRSQ